MKPFSISTPNHVNANFIADSDAKSSKDGSATKGIGAHLLQIE